MVKNFFFYCAWSPPVVQKISIKTTGGTKHFSNFKKSNISATGFDIEMPLRTKLDHGHWVWSQKRPS